MFYIKNVYKNELIQKFAHLSFKYLIKKALKPRHAMIPNIMRINQPIFIVIQAEKPQRILMSQIPSALLISVFYPQNFSGAHARK